MALAMLYVQEAGTILYMMAYGIPAASKLADVEPDCAWASTLAEMVAVEKVV